MELDSSSPSGPGLAVERNAGKHVMQRRRLIHNHVAFLALQAETKAYSGATLAGDDKYSRENKTT